MDDASTYETYVLRCWAEHSDQNDTLGWRFVLIDAGSGDQRVFTSLGALVSELELKFTPDDENE